MSTPGAGAANRCGPPANTSLPAARIMANARPPIWIRSLGRLRARLLAGLIAGLRSLIQRPSG